MGVRRFLHLQQSNVEKHVWILKSEKKMSVEVGSEERVCITQHEQREYDACNWENPDFPGDPLDDWENAFPSLKEQHLTFIVFYYDGLTRPW